MTIVLVLHQHRALANPREGYNYDSSNNINEFCVFPDLEETEYTPLQHFPVLTWASGELVKAFFSLW